MHVIRGFMPTCQQRYCTDKTTFENRIEIVVISILVCRWSPSLYILLVTERGMSGKGNMGIDAAACCFYAHET